MLKDLFIHLIRSNFDKVFFIFCGLISALLYFICLTLMIKGLNSNEFSGYSVAFMVSSAFNFQFNRVITFKNNKKNNIFNQIKKYLLMLLLSYIFGLLIIEIFTMKLQFSVYISSLITIAISAILRYYFSKKIIYV
jgi:putative flippase GtrA